MLNLKKERKEVFLFLCALLFLTIFFILLVNSLPVSAEEIYNDWVINRETIKIGNDLYTFTLSPDEKLLRIVRSGETFLISKGKCKVEPLEKFCFDNVTWDLEIAKLDDNGVLQPGILVSMYSFKADVALSRTLSSSEINYGDTVRVDVKITNSGTKDAESAYYIEEIPDGIDLIQTVGADTIGKRITWSGNIPKEGGEKTFYYIVKPIGYTTRNLTPANLSYEYEGVKQTISCSVNPITIKTPYTATDSLSPESTGIESTATYTLNIENTDKREPLNINLLIDTTNLDIITYSASLKKEGHVFKYSGSTMNKESFYVQVKKTFTGVYNITSFVKMEMNNKIYNDSFSKTLTVATDKVNSGISFNKDSVRSVESVIVYLTITNSDKTNIYYNIIGNLYSEIFNEKINLQKLLAGENYLFQKQYTPPDNEEERDYTVKFNGTYSSEKNEIFPLYTEGSFHVGALNKSFSLSQSIDKSEVFKGGNFTVVVKVKNLKDDPLFNITVSDEFPLLLEFVQGEKSNIVNIVGKEEKQAYIYMLKVPMDYKNDSIIIKTALAYSKEGKSYYTEKTGTVLVKNATLPPQENNETVNPNQQNTSAQQNQTQPGEKPSEDNSKTTKRSWLNKILDSIEGFLSSIFG